MGRAAAVVDSAAQRGEFDVLVGWLRRNIHRRGQLFDARALLAKATGKPLGTAAFLDHLRQRYGS